MSAALELATLDEIVDEIRRRYPHVLLAVLRDAPGLAGQGREEVLYLYRGGRTTAVGLASRTHARLLRECDTQTEDTEEST